MPPALPPPDHQDDTLPPATDVEVSDDQSDVQDTDDGGALVTLPDDGHDGPEFGDFFENLADKIPPQARDDLVLDLLEKIEEDKQARSKRDELQADALRRTGFSDEAPGGAEFTGASKVVHPMIGKAAVEFGARLMKELFPPDGPVKAKIVGEVTGVKAEKAERKANHMNWQLTEQIPEFRPTLEQIETQVPMGGAQYMKIYADPQLKRPTVEAVWVDNMLLPAAAPSFLAARRRTIVLPLTEQEYLRRVDSGMYIDADLAGSMLAPDESKSEKANERIEGKKLSPYNEDGLRTFYESDVWLEVQDDPHRPEGWRSTPYILTIDESSMACVGFYRNWAPDVAERRGIVEQLQHVVEFPFIPWRGALPLGLFHLIGGLTIAATGALRALLDAAHLNTSQTMIKMKGLLRGGQSANIKQTGIHEVEGTVNTDDIRKLAMPLPFNPPSPVLFSLLGFLTEQGADVVRTALDDAAETNSQAPVGTTLARIEQGMQVFAAIHSRQHAAMAQVLKILHRINRDSLTQEVIKEDTGELLALPEDYQGPMDVVPVSDPNIFSEMQRYAQTQAIAARAMGNPLYNQAKVEERILATLKIPDPDELLITPPEPEAADPVTENVALALGRPATAFPNQDHVAHLTVHLRFLTDEMIGLSQLIGPTLVPPMLGHVKEHLVLLYAKMMADTVTRATGGRPLPSLIDQDPKTQDALARAFGAAAPYVHEEEGNIFANAQKAVEAAIAFMEKMQEKLAPQDPSIQVAKMGAQIEHEKTALQAQKMQGDQKLKQGDQQLKAQGQQADEKVKQAGLSLDAAKLHQQSAVDDAEHQRASAATAGDLQREAVAAGVERRKLDLAAAQLDLERRLALLEQANKLQMNREDNLTAKQIAVLEAAVDKHKTNMSTGHGVNPG